MVTFRQQRHGYELHRVSTRLALAFAQVLHAPRHGAALRLNAGEVSLAAGLCLSPRRRCGRLCSAPRPPSGISVQRLSPSNLADRGHRVPGYQAALPSGRYHGVAFENRPRSTWTRLRTGLTVDSTSGRCHCACWSRRYSAVRTCGGRFGLWLTLIAVKKQIY